MIDIQQGKLAKVHDLNSEPLDSYFRVAVQSKPDGLREAIELRRALETQIAWLAAARATEEEIQILESIVEELARRVDSTDPWVDLDLEFHLALARSAKNQLMFHLVEALSGFMKETIRMLHVQRELRETQATLERHVNILKALKARDPEACRQAMMTHFDATYFVVGAIESSRKSKA